MTTFTWKERLKVSVWEINRAKALRVAQTVNNLLDIHTDDSGFISSELDAAFVLNAPCKVMWDGEPLTDGAHTLAIDDYEVALTLPLTRECFDALPVSLAAAWIEAAQTENGWLSTFFIVTLRGVQTNGERQSVDLPS